MRLTLHTDAQLTAGTDDRVVAGRLLPYGQEGRTSLGRVTVRRGALTLAERIVANLEHDRTRPVGVLVAHEDTDDGLDVRVRLAATRAGDDLLAEVTEGLRTGLSVEVDDPVIRRGELVAGTVTALGFVVEPAFPDARLAAALAEDTEAVVNDDGSVAITTPSAAVTVTVTDPTPQEDPVAPETTTDTEVTASAPAQAPAALVASGATGARPTAPRTFTEHIERLCAGLELRPQGRDQMLAALSDITYTAVGADLSEPQWLGELWSGVPYERSVVPQLAQGRLTSLKVNSWKWTTKPAMASYAGNKAAITSNAAATDPVTGTASRLAGGHDIDRAMVDFPESGFWESYYRAMAESYARLTDAAALAAIKAGGTSVTAGDVPPGVTGAAAALVDGALAVIDTGVPTFAFVAPDIYRALLLTPRNYVLDLISSALGVKDGSLLGLSVIPRTDLTDGDVIVGTRSAATFYELGPTPIRVDAVNIANGGVDAGVFGYYFLQIHDADGIAVLTGVDPAFVPAEVTTVAP